MADSICSVVLYNEGGQNGQDGQDRMESDLIPGGHSVLVHECWIGYGLVLMGIIQSL